MAHVPDSGGSKPESAVEALRRLAAKRAAAAQPKPVAAPSRFHGRVQVRGGRGRLRAGGEH